MTARAVPEHERAETWARLRRIARRNGLTPDEQLRRMLDAEDRRQGRDSREKA